jgi:hypothetical protein
MRPRDSSSTRAAGHCAGVGGDIGGVVRILTAAGFRTLPGWQPHAVPNPADYAATPLRCPALHARCSLAHPPNVLSGRNRNYPPMVRYLKKGAPPAPRGRPGTDHEKSPPSGSGENPGEDRRHVRSGSETRASPTSRGVPRSECSVDIRHHCDHRLPWVAVTSGDHRIVSDGSSC